MIDHVLPLFLFVLAASDAPSGLSDSYVDDAAVQGSRPARDVRAALRSVFPALSACVKDGSADVYADVEVLAAGFVDRISLFAKTPGSDDIVDGACVAKALRAMTLPDRGVEPPTHAIVRLAARPGGARPALHSGPADVAAALDVHLDELERCVEQARLSDAQLHGTLIARLSVERSGAIKDVDVIGGSLASERARRCIVDELKTAHLPANGEDLDVAWPLSFAPRPPPPDGRRRTMWEEPTLFRFLGCASAMQG